MDSADKAAATPLDADQQVNVLLWLDGAQLFEQAILASSHAARASVSTFKEAEHPPDDVLARTDVVVAWRLPPGIMSRMPRLKWIQCQSAGVDDWLARPDLDPKVTLTGARGIHRIQMPDTIIGALYSITKPFEEMRQFQARREWGAVAPKFVAGRTLSIVGLGEIGCNLAKKAAALEMRVVGVKRTPAPVPGVDRVVGLDQMDEVLAEADYVVVLLPVTPATIDLFDARRFKAMKPSAWFLNFARGQLVVDDDLIGAVDSKTIAGAVLDVFRKEPLPAEHPFWSTENIIIYPHIGGRHPRRSDFVVGLFKDNLDCFFSGRPLRSEIDRDRGY